MPRKIGFITTGQSPRDDVMGEFRPLLGSGVGVIEKGALDGLSRPEIEALKPGKGDFPLITRLRDETAVVVSKKRIISLLQRQIEELENAGVDLSALLCTEDFEGMVSRRILLLPSRILKALVSATLNQGRLAVLAPLRDQKRYVKKKWRRSGISLTVETLNPYGRFEKLEEVINQIQVFSPDLIVLDCIGYALSLRDKIRERTNKPVLLPRQVLVSVIKLLL